MRVVKCFAMFMAVLFAASLAYAQIFVIKDGVSKAYQSGSIVKIDGTDGAKAAAVAFNGIKINLDPKANYTFSEVDVKGIKSLAAQLSGQASIVINDSVIKTKDDKTTMILTPKVGSNEIAIQVLEGQVSVNAKAAGSGSASSSKQSEQSVKAGSEFLLLAIDFDLSLDQSHYKFKEDLTRPISSSNP